MVFDHISAYERYQSMHPRFQEAFAFLRNAQSLNPGRYELAGGMYINVGVKAATHPAEGTRFEVHRKYIDIQYIVEGEATLGWNNIKSLRPAIPYNEQKDCEMLEGSGLFIRVPAQYMFIAWPEDAHMPGCSLAQKTDEYRVIIAKVPV